MSEPTIYAHISEVPDSSAVGAYYPTKLYAIPRVGELIQLYSRMDEATKHPPTKRYEVVQVAHYVYDVTDKPNIPRGNDGYHHISIIVKESNSAMFSHLPS